MYIGISTFWIDSWLGECMVVILGVSPGMTTYLLMYAVIASKGALLSVGQCVVGRVMMGYGLL